MRFPDDPSIADVTKAPYNARGDGRTDCTGAIQKALNESVGGIVYLPDGTYVISNTLRWPGRQMNTTLWGQSTDGAVLKLKDRCPGFTDPGNPKAMVWTGRKPAQRFKNYVRGLTFDTGKGNPGAIGAQFMANNTGAFREVTIRSGDGAGAIGLDLGYSDEQGPCLIKNVTVIGFEIGIETRHVVDSVTMEHITLKGQRQVGLRNKGQVVSCRGLVSENSVSAVENAGAALLVLIDSKLSGKGTAAIVNEKPAALLARNVEVSGYEAAVRNASGHGKGAAAGTVEEFDSHEVLALFDGPRRSLGLPIKETPKVEWGDPADWVSIARFGAAESRGRKAVDCTAAVQKAIDSGARTVYVPKGTYEVGKTVHIRGEVQRIVGLGQSARFRGRGVFRLEEGDAAAVVLEGLGGVAGGIEQASKRTLIVRNLHVNSMGQQAISRGVFNSDTGDIFLEDIGGPRLSFRDGVHVWGRQINTEWKHKVRITNDGATLWILGHKLERGGTAVETVGGGRTEILGGFMYTITPPVGPLFISRDSEISVSMRESKFSPKFAPFKVLVRETRGGGTRELKHGQAPEATGGSLIPLFVGRAD